MRKMLTVILRHKSQNSTWGLHMNVIIVFYRFMNELSDADAFKPEGFFISDIRPGVSLLCFLTKLTALIIIDKYKIFLF